MAGSSWVREAELQGPMIELEKLGRKTARQGLQEFSFLRHLRVRR